MKNLIDYMLILIRQTQRGNSSKNIRARAIYKCDCGVFKELIISNVNSGTTKSCGCLRASINNSVKHLLCKHPIYKVWDGMKSRCYNHNHIAYKWYGGKGVKICDDWLFNFKLFYDWCLANGWKKGLKIDKDIKGTGLLYSPDNCLIVTQKENINRELTNK